jgi:carotenoid 1,2-hydratase
VFSPWYKFARRGGRPADPAQHCALNVALYGRGGKRWSMTERGAGALARDSENLHIGPSSLRWDGTTLTVDFSEITAPIPTRLRGTLRLYPHGLATHQVALDGVGKHRWSPLAPGAPVEVDLQSPALRWKGTAYFDTNAGDEPLEDAFIAWDWCRAPLDHGMAVLYHGHRRNGTEFCTALRYTPQGQAEPFEAPQVATLPRSFWRIPRATRCDPAATARVEKTLEDTPFYVRSLVSTRLLGQNATAIHESLSLDRFVTPIVQFMLPFKAPRALATKPPTP